MSDSLDAHRGNYAKMRPFLQFMTTHGSSHTRGLVLFSILTNLMVLAPSFHMLQIYDRVLSSKSQSTLLYITLIALFAIAVYGIGEAVRMRIAQRLSATYAVTVAQKMFARFASLPQSDTAAGGYLRDYGLVKQFLGSKTLITLFDLPFLPVYLILLLFVHPAIFAMTLLGSLALIAIGAINIVRTEKSRLDSRSSESDAMGFAQHAFTHGDSIRSLGLLPQLIALWGFKSSNALIAAEESTRRTAFYYALSRAVRQSIQILTMAVGGWLVLIGNMSGGMIFMASMVSGKALAPIEQLIGSWEQISKSVAAFEHVESLTGTDKRLQSKAPLADSNGRLSAENISFYKSKHQPVLDGVSIAVNPGEIVLLQGAAASGKSTLLRILSGAIAPEEGTVYLSDKPKELWPQAQWGHSMGYVSSEPSLLPGTVAANIGRFIPNVDIGKVDRAVKLVGINTMIGQLPNGYSTEINSGTSSLSTSQLKQIALARAFFNFPKTLILDQPTEGFDDNAEAEVMSALVAASKAGAAIIVASNNPRYISIATRRVVLEEGKLTEARVDRRKGRQSDAQRPDGLPERRAPTSLLSGLHKQPERLSRTA